MAVAMMAQLMAQLGAVDTAARAQDSNPCMQVTRSGGFEDFHRVLYKAAPRAAQGGGGPIMADLYVFETRVTDGYWWGLFCSSIWGADVDRLDKANEFPSLYINVWACGRSILIGGKSGSPTIVLHRGPRAVWTGPVRYKSVCVAQADNSLSWTWTFTPGSTVKVKPSPVARPGGPLYVNF